jgi:hypothetical protein
MNPLEIPPSVDSLAMEFQASNGATPLAAHKHSQLVAAAMRQLPNNLPGADDRAASRSREPHHCDT